MKTKMVVVDVYQLGRTAEGYTLEFKTINKKAHVMTRSFVEDMTQEIMEDKPAWTKSGKLFEIDEKATEEWYVKFEEKQENMKQKATIQEAKASGLLEKAMSGAINNAVKAEVVIPEGDPNESWDEMQLKAWLKLKEIKFGGRTGYAKLLEKAKENL